MKFKDLSVTFHTDKITECVDYYIKYFHAKMVFDAGWYVTVRLERDKNSPIFISFQSSEKITRNNFTGGVTLNLLTGDVDAYYRELKKSGILFLEEITDHTWGDRAFSVQDPIGNIVYIYSEREMDDEYKPAIKE